MGLQIKVKTWFDSIQPWGQKIINMLRHLILIALLGGTASTLPAKELVLVHYELGGGLAPYFLADEQKQKYIGIIPDMLSGLEGIKLTFKPVPRKRLDEALKSATINFALTHPDYTTADDALIFIPSHLEQTKMLYRSTTNSMQASDLNDINNAKICSRLGYKNPQLDEILEKQNLEYALASNNRSLLTMLVKNRCDFLVGSTDVIDHEISKNHLSDIEKTSITLSTKPFYFAISKHLRDSAERIKTHIDTLKQSGALQAILDNYTHNDSEHP